MADIKVRIGQSDAIKVIASRQGVTGESATSAYSNQSGISSSSNYAISAGIATYTTYAENSGISTNVIGGIGSVTQLNVSGLSTFSGNINIPDNISAKFGNDGDLELVHYDTNHSIIRHTGSGNLQIWGDTVQFNASNGVGPSLTVNTDNGLTVNGSIESQYLNITGFTTISNTTAGVITATRFFGDGSGLTGVTASGTGVNVRDNGSVIGVAATIDFGQNLAVSPVSSGFVTVTATPVNQFTNLEVTGITTLSNLKISSGVITTTSGIVTYYGDVAQIDGGSY